MSPFSLSDAEIDLILNLAAPIPPEHRDAFLQTVAAALSKYPESGHGPGLVHREARQLQRYFTNPPPTKAAINGPRPLQKLR
jgi:hypothetical protein